MTRHLAQLNIGKLKGGKDDPAMAGFFDNLDRVNAAAERMPGFVWRLKDDSGNATGIPWVGDPTIAVNLTVWESVDALEKFVWQTVHTKIYNRKGEFFEKMTTPHFVMWWIEPGHAPTAGGGQGKARSSDGERPRRICLRLGGCALGQALARQKVRVMATRKLIVDGKEIEAEETITLLQACEQAGAEIPASAITSVCRWRAIAACAWSSGWARPSRKPPARCR